MSDAALRAAERSGDWRARVTALRRAGRDLDARAFLLDTWRDACARADAIWARINRRAGDRQALLAEHESAVRDMEESLEVEGDLRRLLLRADPTLCFIESCGYMPHHHHHPLRHQG